MSVFRNPKEGQNENCWKNIQLHKHFVIGNPDNFPLSHFCQRTYCVFLAGEGIWYFLSSIILIRFYVFSRRVRKHNILAKEKKPHNMRIFIAKNPRKAKHLFSPSKKRQSKMLKGLKRMKFFKHDDFYKFLVFRRSKINTSIKIEICKFRTIGDLFDWWKFSPIRTLPIFF